jgi:small subunit ribosomal protein S16
MVRIRFRRMGAKRQPSYRMVVANSESPRDGRFIETIGHYNPRTDPPTIDIQEDRALYWLSVGAQPSDAVRRMLDKRGLFERLPDYRKSGGATTPPATDTPSYTSPDLVEAPDVVEEMADEAGEDIVAEAAGTVAAEASEGEEERGMAEADEAIVPDAEEVSP